MSCGLVSSGQEAHGNAREWPWTATRSRGSSGRRGSETTEGTIARRFVEAFGGRDHAALDEDLAEDVVFYGTPSWGRPGRESPKAFADRFQEGSPGPRDAQHDEFYGADGERGSMRLALRVRNTGRFFGKEPTGKKGVSMETFTMRIRDGKIVEPIQGGNTPTLGYIEAVDLGLPFPTDTPDPQPEITSSEASRAD